MKKRTWMVGCLLLFLIASSVATADESVPGFRLGVEGGINLANLNGANVNDVFASRLGFVGGGFLNLPLGPVLAFQPEVLYEQKGGKFNGSPYQLDYVEVPLLLDISLLGPIGILVGPAFDANVASQGVASVNSTDVGAIMGVQVIFGNLLASGRYEVGFDDISSNQKIQNGTFSFLLGLSFI